MRTFLVLLGLSVLCVPLCGCGKRYLDRSEVAEFIEQADNAARKRFAPEICALRGKQFTLATIAADGSKVELGRRLYCAEAGKFSRLRQYKLERPSMDVELAPDRKTARVTAIYIEAIPAYEAVPATPDDFQEYQIIETRDISTVGLEDGDLKFLRTEVATIREKLVPKSTLDLPYE